MSSEIPTGPPEDEKPKEYKPFIGKGIGAFYKDGELIVTEERDSHRHTLVEMGLAGEEEARDKYREIALKNGLTLVSLSHWEPKDALIVLTTKKNQSQIRTITEEMIGARYINYDTRVIGEVSDDPEKEAIRVYNCLAAEVVKQERKSMKLVSPEDFKERKK